MVDRAAVENFDLEHLPVDFIDDPFPYYHALRTYAPIHRSPDGSYFLTRYDDLAFIYRDPRVSSDKKVLFRPKFGDSPLFEHHTTSLVFSDPPYHTRVRRLIMGALHPNAVKAMEPDLIALVGKLLDRIEEKREFDLIDDYATAIPIEVIGNLLRIPRDGRAPLRGWSLAILGALEPTNTAEELAWGNRSVEEFCAYLRVLIDDRRRHLSDDKNDVLSQLIIGEPDGEKLTERELLQNCIFLLNAGHETTTNLIGNGVHALLTHPEELQRLRKEPHLIRSAVEEVLRFESSNQLGNRMVAEDLELGGMPMPAGTQLSLCIGAANRDPAHFPDPDRFDIARSPNNHFAFATGVHACAGMSLARLEGRIAIQTMIERFPELRLAGAPVRRQRARFRGFESVPLATA
jgi:cytochrome P450